MKVTMLLIFTINIVSSILVLHMAEITQNTSLVSVKFDYFNDNVTDTVINVIIKNFVAFNNIRMYIKVDYSMNKNDQFNTNLINTVVDMQKLFRGALANPIIKTVTDSLLKNTNFKLKLPFRPVSNIKSTRNLIDTYFNATISKKNIFPLAGNL